MIRLCADIPSGIDANRLHGIWALGVERANTEICYDLLASVECVGQPRWQRTDAGIGRFPGLAKAGHAQDSGRANPPNADNRVTVIVAQRAVGVEAGSC